MRCIVIPLCDSRAASKEVATQHGASSTNSRSRQANHKESSGSTSRSKSTVGYTELNRMREEGPRRMYDQHDMSTHEVVVRSMLEVLQEFGEADAGDRTVSKHYRFQKSTCRFVSCRICNAADRNLGLETCSGLQLVPLHRSIRVVSLVRQLGHLSAIRSIGCISPFPMEYHLVWARL